VRRADRGQCAGDEDDTCVLCPGECMGEGGVDGGRTHAVPCFAPIGKDSKGGEGKMGHCKGFLASLERKIERKKQPVLGFGKAAAAPRTGRTGGGGEDLAGQGGILCVGRGGCFGHLPLGVTGNH